jgi:hypothetical protein
MPFQPVLAGATDTKDEGAHWWGRGKDSLDYPASDFQWRSVRYIDVHKADDPTLQ